jgi:hypothetical protein
MRSRLVLVVLPGLAIGYSVYAALRAMESRQEAAECEQASRVAASRADSFHRRWSRYLDEHAPTAAAAAAAVRARQLGQPVPRPPASGAALISRGDTALLGSVAVGGAVSAHTAPPPPVVLRAPPGDKADAIRHLRKIISGTRVVIEEMRIGSTIVLGEQRLRTLRFRLAGRPESLQKAIAAIRGDDRIEKLSPPRIEALRRGEARAVLTGLIRSDAGETGPPAPRGARSGLRPRTSRSALTGGWGPPAAGLPAGAAGEEPGIAPAVAPAASAPQGS